MKTPCRFVSLVLAAAFVLPGVAADAYVPNPLAPVVNGRSGPVVDATCATPAEGCRVKSESYTHVSKSADTRVSFTAAGHYAFDLDGVADSAFMSLEASGGASDDVHCKGDCHGYLRSTVTVERGSTVVVSGNVYWCDWWCWIRKDYPYATTIEVL